MKTKGAILILLLAFTFTAFAQETKKAKSHQGFFEIGGASFVTSGETPVLGTADFIYGRKFNPHCSMGIGVGIRYASDAISETRSYLVPLYGNFRANLFSDTSEKIFPYTQTKIGVAFASGNRAAMLHQSFGVGFKDSPVSFGLCGEIFSFNGLGALSIGLNLGFSF